MDDEALARQLQEEFDQEVRAKELKERFECPLCFDTTRLDEGVELDCRHRICRECLSAYLQVKIQEKLVTESELCCPMPGCGQAMTVPQVEGAIRGTPLWDRFLKTRAELWRPALPAPAFGRQLPERERLCECPNPSCDERFLVSPKMAEVRCPKCTSNFCRMCRERHPGTTCEAHAQATGSQGVDKDLELLIAQNRWQRCPKCTAVTERETGCNYMTCHSEKCRGKVCYCYLCGVALSTVEHYTHFPHGMFENACVNADLRNDSALPKGTWGTPEWFSAVARDVTSYVTG
mmetsp:Transcript_170503/g.541632  ORF Transcript_170503/g.541632 Transcript_170503/m.541632 type:complete len:291 (-) Transcript_170503:69-941(-)